VPASGASSVIQAQAARLIALLRVRVPRQPCSSLNSSTSMGSRRR
jgi:hypothetical protein